jgi:rhamnopyranosyl-N-acetylglucosaminyl-diphospho-decaprenol beta-1,3/1,4-galactofuranosyltransferase
VIPENDKPTTIFITVVMATMNRSGTVAECVRALSLQTRPPDRVIVSDNVSTDDTVEVLENLTGLPFQLTVHRMQTNRGNAGGVEEAMSLAFSDEADAVWILDDDSWPRPESLEKLLGGHWSAMVVRHAIQVCPGTSRLTWPLPVRDGANRWKLIWSTEELPAGDYLQTRASWTGALISRQIFDDVGPVNGELFIRGEDEEYPWRIEQAGYTFEAAVGATMDHPGPQNMIHWKFLGRSLFLERNLADTKLYYKVRNMVWLKRQQAGKVEAGLMALAYLGGIPLLEGPRRLPLLWRSIRHGFQGRLGTMKP